MITLEKTTHSLDSGGQVVFAGGNQFRTLWARDFCYSVEGLLAAGKSALVRYELKLLFHYLSKDGFLPRGLDVIAPQWRVVQNTILKWLPIFPTQYPVNEVAFKSELTAEYLGEHKTPAYDSNALFVLSYVHYGQKTSDWFLNWDTQVMPLLTVYNQHKNDLLFAQPAFSDWQDSANRAGTMALLQLQILAAFEAGIRCGFIDPAQLHLDAFKKAILDTFFNPDTYLFFQEKTRQQMALDCYGFIFRYGLFSDQIDFSRLYNSLKQTPLWQNDQCPGIPVHPPYKGSEVSWTTKAVGLARYHDGFYWGWLIAEAAYIAKKQKDVGEYLSILKIFEASIQSAETLAEIYVKKEKYFIEYSGILYRSENPFTWTAAKWLGAIHL